MLYYLFDFLDKQHDFIGAGVFKYISFRAAMSAVVSLLFSILYGKKIIRYLRRKQIGEDVRDLGLQGQMEKKGTPTMGGIIIIISILIPVLLFVKIDNIYIILLLITMLGLAFIGFLDDYLKKTVDKKGLPGKFKVLGQVVIGLVVGVSLYFFNDVSIQEHVPVNNAERFETLKKNGKVLNSTLVNDGKKPAYHHVTYRTTATNVPFFKNNRFDYKSLNIFNIDSLNSIIYIAFVIFIITAVSNGANITDGIDGLAAGTAAIIGFTLAVFAYVSGNSIFSQYLNIMYIPDIGEVVVFATAFVGACVGFLWYNSFPAQVFMGDTGSLSLGGVIAVMALSVRKELMLPLLCGIFVIENLSVVLQVFYFKHQKKKRGLEFARANRLFKMAPLHHHYQKVGFHESKIVTRFWIIGIILAILSLVTLKLR